MNMCLAFTSKPKEERQMYSWIIRISAAVVGVVLLVMVRLLEWYPIFYAVPLTMILFAFLDCAESTENRQPIADDVRKVVIKPDNRRWDFADEECYREAKRPESKRIHKIVM